MKILYVFPHPDDESFGPAPAMAKQRRQGHDVYLLTLTKGGATRQRAKYGYTVAKMGDVRHREMLEVERVLSLSGMNVLDLPDSGLKEMDPRKIEAVVAAEVKRIRPHVVVTYAVHGVSGFHDHLVSHAIVKRVFLELKDDVPPLQRLALLTITEEKAAQATLFHLNGSTADEIDCVVEVQEEDLKKGRKALDCYVTFQETIEKSGIRNFLGPVSFEIFQERHDPPLHDLFEGLE